MTKKVNNRRNFCDHCSLCTDVPPFISYEHAQDNANRIRDGEVFGCHMLFDPFNHDKAPGCLGAALSAKDVELVNKVTDERTAYPSLEEYVKTQTRARVTNEWLIAHGERWKDRHGVERYGFWRAAPTGTWAYLLISPEENDSGSAYWFFDQCQKVFGPLKREQP